ncbi:MAG TPA: hypothetical protein VFH45_12095 [Acidimicrobiales bacterium]|nr:hypothetical protein [Acidimicrobiales bacterium]
MIKKTLAATAVGTVALVASAGASWAAGAGSTATPSEPTVNTPSNSSATAPSKPTTGGSRPSSANCPGGPDGGWPAYVNGALDHFDAGDGGFFLWHDPRGGWGLRVSHPGRSRVVMSGTISTPGTITGFKRVDLEKGDRVTVGPDGHTLAFRFANYGRVDGVDFTTSCAPGLRVDVAVNGHRAPASAVHLGDRKVHPRQVPFDIVRTDRDAATPTPQASSPAPTAATAPTATGAAS